MSDEQRTRWRRVAACGVFVLLLTAAWPAAATPRWCAGGGLIALSVDVGATGDSGPLGRFTHRLTRRAENSVNRLSDLLGAAGFVWFSILASVVVFLSVTAVSSVADFRMFALRRKGPGAIARYLGHGTLTFLRILRDRRTPNIARLVLLLALVYWLMPIDLIPDTTLVPGFVDDLLIAISAAKGFLYFCPDSLVALHAAEVEARA